MKHIIAGIFAAVAIAAATGAHAQNTTKVVGTCGTATYTAGKMAYPTQDTTGVTCTSSGGGGGGGAVTIADGADVTQGHIADATVASGASGTVESYLRTIKDASVSTADTSVKISQATPGTTNAVQSVAGTTGGATPYHVIAGASDNHAVIKNGAGTVYVLTGTSIHSTYQYVRLYDAGTGFNGCNSATNLKAGYIIPGATTGSGGQFSFPVGLLFATGISVCITGAFSDTDTTNATASVLSLNVGYN